ncbi:MAG: AIPR family protein [Bellilinea sp.]|jgi:hypothetical protein
MDNSLTFSDFREEWLADIIAGNPSTVELGNRFSRKLITQWLDIGEDSDDIIYCDGSGDGGIDIAFLQRDEVDGNGAVGHTWYLVQSKYGSAFQGTDTLFIEGRKVIDTLSGHRHTLSSIAQDLFTRLTTFMAQASEHDQISIVFASTEPLTEEEERAMNDVRILGQERLGGRFEVVSVTVNTIYEKAVDTLGIDKRIQVPIRAILSDTGSGLLVGTVTLVDLYDFLKGYQRANRGDLDMIYEKNVRRFLGGRGRVNAAIQRTLENAPEKFGLYNNGITIVAAHFGQDNGSLILTEPFIVNGCQTTRTIWDVLRRRLEAGGTGNNPQFEDWRSRLSKGVVVVKIVKVGDAGESMLVDITRFTNSQNAVREKDFLSLVSDFKTWQKQIGDIHDIYLEIQRGGWDSQKAFQKQHPLAKQFRKYANAFDLLKVYGAGWLAEAGTAFRSNAPFLPNGVIYRQIVNADSDAEDAFGVDDFYATYLLQEAADKIGFGRNTENISRRQTRFLFYMIAVDILKDVILRADLPLGRRAITRSIIALATLDHDAARTAWLDTTIEAIDSYMREGTDNSVFLEPAFKAKFNNDLNAFLKWEQLGKSEESTPRLRSQLTISKSILGMSVGGQPSGRNQIISVIKSH